MAGLLGQLLLELGINTAAWKDGLDKATYQAQAFAKEVSNQFASIGDAVGRLGESFAGLSPELGGAVSSITSAFKNIADAGGGVAGTTTGIIGAFVAAGVAADGLAIHAGLSAAKIGELSKATGVSVPTLSLLGDIAGTVGIGVDQMGKALERMDRSALAAAQQGPKASNAYRDLGIAVTDTTGAMRPAEAIFNDVAKRFSEMADGPQKTALAIKIFGRAGAEMIPLLDEGGAKLAALEEHFSKLGATVDEATAASGEELKTNMALMQGAFQGVENELAKQLVPALNEVADEFISFFENNHDQVVQFIAVWADAGKIVLNLFQGFVTTIKVVQDAFFGLIGVLQGTFQGLGFASRDALEGNFKQAWADIKQGGADAANAAKLSWSDAAKDIKDGITDIGKVWDATNAKPEKSVKPSSAPPAKSVDTTWIDNMVAASERAMEKQKELAEAVGKVSSATIEARASAQSGEEIQRLWDEAVAKGETTSGKFLAAWRAAVPQIQANVAWMETFKAAVADQQGLDTLDEKLNKQIAALKDVASAHSALALAQAKNNAELTPLIDHLNELKTQYDLITNGGKNVSDNSVKLAADIKRQGDEIDALRLKTKALNDELETKAVADFAESLKKMTAEAGAANAIEAQVAKTVEEDTAKWGEQAVNVDAVRAATIQAAAAKAVFAASKAYDPSELVVMQTAINDLNQNWKAMGLTADQYGKTLLDLKAKTADLAAQSNSFTAGITAGFAKFAASIPLQGQIMEKLTDQALTGITDQFTEMVTTGKAKWQDLVTSMEKTLVSSEIKSLLGKLFSTVGQSGGILGQIFGGSGIGGGGSQAAASAALTTAGTTLTTAGAALTGAATALTTAAATMSASGGAGGAGGGLASLLGSFGGGQERGGDVTPGKWYVVGEKRPEVFVPHTSGTILPSAAPSAMTGGDTHVTMNVQTSDADSFRKSSGQMLRDMTRQVSIGNSRNRGGY
jgi:hypothetical protein